MLFETQADLILPLGVAAAVFLFLAIGAGIIAMLNMLKGREYQDNLEKAERKIDHLERRMFHVLNAVPVALVETDATGKYTFANKAAHTLVGRKDSELIGLRYHSATWGITYPDGRVIPTDLLPLARSLRGQTVKGFQHLIALPHTHDKMLVSVTSQPISNANGEIIGATSAIVELERQSGEGVGDITGLWRGQWFSAATVPFWGLDQDGTVLDLNASAGETLGHEREALLNANWAQVLVAEVDFQTALDYLTAVQNADPSKSAPAPVKIGLKDAKGDIRPVLLSAWKVETSDAKHQGMTVMAAPALSLRNLKARDEDGQDITEKLNDLKRAEAARAALGVGAWFYDPQSDAIVEDAGMRALIGRQVEGGPTLISDNDQARADQAFIRLMSGQTQTLELEIRVDHTDGPRWIALKGQARQSDDETRDIFGVASDITAYKQAIEDESNLRAVAFEKAMAAEASANESREKAVAVINAAAPTAPMNLLGLAEGLIGLTRMWVKSGEALSLNSLSPQWMTLTGLSAHQFLGEGWLDSVIDADQPELAAELLRLMETREESQLSYRLKPQADEAEGKLILEYVKPVYREDGSLEGLLGLGFDITDHIPAVSPLAVPVAAPVDEVYGWHDALPGEAVVEAPGTASAPVSVEDFADYQMMKARAERLERALNEALEAQLPDVQTPELDIESSPAYQALEAKLAEISAELEAARAVPEPEPEPEPVPELIIEDSAEYQALKAHAETLEAELAAAKAEPVVEAVPVQDVVVQTVEDFSEYHFLKARAIALEAELEAVKSAPEPVAPVVTELEDFAEYQALKAHAETLEAELEAARNATKVVEVAAPRTEEIRPEDVPEYLTLKAHAQALEAALDSARAALDQSPLPQDYDALVARNQALEAQLQLRGSEEHSLRSRLDQLETITSALAQSEAARQTLSERAEGLSAHVQNLLHQQSLLEARSARLDEALSMAQRFETVGRLTGNVASDFNQMLGVINNALDLIQQQTHNPDNIKRLSEAALAAGRRGERLTRQLQAFTLQDEVIG